MTNKRFTWFLFVVMSLTFVLAACQPAAPTTVEVTVEVPVEKEVQVTVVVEKEVEQNKAPLGSAERPIKVLFVPSTEAEAIVSGGEVMAAALEDATGYKFEVSVPTSYAATVEAICASPDDTIAFLPAQAYVLANSQCGVQVGGAAVRFGLSWYAAQIVVRADSGITTLQDLNGKTWARPSATSTSGSLFPSAMFMAEGVVPGEIVDAGGHSNSMLAVYNGEVDFATAFFSPPLLPKGTWSFGDDPEVWRAAGVTPVRNDAGRTFVAGGPSEGGYRVLDARAGVSDTAPDIFDQTVILALTDQIPNDTVSFGPEFPLNVASKIIASLVEFTQTEACQTSICSDDFYGWTGLEPVSDSFYDSVRFLIETLGLTEDDILK